MRNFKLPAWNCVPFKSNVSALFLAGAVALAFFIPSAQAQDEAGVGPFRTQTIELNAGWNAVYLEIQPTAAEPEAFFEGTPVEIAAAYFRPVTAMEFFESPTDVLPDRKGWSVWYAPERDDHLLTDLYRMQAHHAYLFYSSEAHTLSVEGTPFYGAAKWYPNSYSLVGFHIDGGQAPTLANFFTGSTAQENMKIYTLSNGRWALVNDPASSLMVPGRAYWAYSKGASKFSGPLTVSFNGSSTGGLTYGPNTGARELVIKNVSTYPQDLTLDLEAGTSGLIPLAYRVMILNGPDAAISSTSISLSGSLSLGTLEPGEAFKLALEVEQSAVTEAVMSTTLIFSSDAGLQVDVPVVSVRGDLVNP